MALADTLSRLPSTNNQEIDFDTRVSMVRFSTDRLNKIHRATMDNATLCQLTSMIVKGWPTPCKRYHLPSEATGPSEMSCPLKMGSS